MDSKTYSLRSKCFRALGFVLQVFGIKTFESQFLRALWVVCRFVTLILCPHLSAIWANPSDSFSGWEAAPAERNNRENSVCLFLTFHSLKFKVRFGRSPTAFRKPDLSSKLVEALWNFKSKRRWMLSTTQATFQRLPSSA